MFSEIFSDGNVKVRQGEYKMSGKDLNYDLILLRRL